MPATFPTSAPALKTDYADNTDDVMAANQNQPNLEINAVAAKVGTGSSTPASAKILKGNGAGTSAWDLDFKDEDDMASDSATAVPSQQSVKAYADGLISGFSPNGRFWRVLPTVTRVSATQFTVPDASGATGWVNILSKGTCLKWTHSTTHQAMIISSSYDANVVTVNIFGDTLDAGFTDTSFSYAIEKAKEINFAIAGTMATGTDLAGTFYAPYAMKVFGADIFAKTAPTGAVLTLDINDDGTTMFTTKPSIADGGTSDVDNTANDNIVVAEDSLITVDVDAIGSTVPGIDAYVKLYFIPNNNQYLT